MGFLLQFRDDPRLIRAPVSPVQAGRPSRTNAKPLPYRSYNSKDCRPFSDIHSFDRTESFEEFSEHIVLPLVLVGNVMNRMLEWNDRMSFPPRAGRPMEDHAVGRSVPFGASELLDLMLDDFVGPDPVEKIDESRIVRLDRQGIGP
jgi:hypothetical protein